MAIFNSASYERISSYELYIDSDYDATQRRDAIGDGSYRMLPVACRYLLNSPIFPTSGVRPWCKDRVRLSCGCYTAFRLDANIQIDFNE